MEIDEISLSKGMFLSIKETDTLREAYKRLKKENKTLKDNTIEVCKNFTQIENKEIKELKERVKELEVNVKLALQICDNNESNHDYSVSTDSIRAVLTFDKDMNNCGKCGIITKNYANIGFFCKNCAVN